MEKVYAWAILALFVGLVLGGIFSVQLFPKEVEVEPDCPSSPVCEVCEVCPESTVCEEVEPEEIERDYRNEAYLSVLEEIGDEDEFLTCEDYEYDADEVEVSRWYDDWGIEWSDDDEYTVWFTAKFRFDTEDDRPCRETRTYSVFYEEGEDPEVELVVEEE